MSNSTKKNRLPLYLGIGALLLSCILLVVATLMQWIPANVENAGAPFGALAALYSFLFAFVPDPGLTGGGQTFWADTQSLGGIIGLSLFLVLFVSGIVFLILGLKKKKGTLVESIFVILGGFYVSYLLSFLVNALVRQNIVASATPWLYVIVALAFVGYVLIWFSLIRSFLLQEKAPALETKTAPKIDEEAVVRITNEEYAKSEKERPEPADEHEVEVDAEKAIDQHEVDAHDVPEKPVVLEAEPENEESVEEASAEETKEPVEEKADDPVEEAPVEEKTEEEPVEEIAAAKLSGKYEVFPEAGFYKYRLKANNGQILLVSNSYKTQLGAMKGIDTLRKNVEVGTHRVVVDKKGRGQFRIFTANDARLVVAGEIYPNAEGAEKALDSVLRFYATDKVVKLDEIPAEEIREWRAEPIEVKPTPNGKIETHIDEEKKFFARLCASNGEILFETVSYATKAGLASGLKGIKDKVAAGNVSVVCDKQGSYQFKVYSDNGVVLVMGQTYPSKERALSAYQSTANFLAGDPKAVDLTKAEPVLE